MATRATVLRGKAATLPEYNFGVALDSVGLDYIFQYPVYIGGTAGKRTTTIDFLVFTNVKKTPVYIDGRYWHGYDREKKEKIIRRLVEKNNPQFRSVISIDAIELGTVEAAKKAIQKYIGVP